MGTVLVERCPDCKSLVGDLYEHQQRHCKQAEHRKELARTLGYLAGLSSMQRPNGWDVIEREALLAGAKALAEKS